LPVRVEARAAPVIITFDVNHATRYYCTVAIKMFKCADAEDVEFVDYH